VRERTFCTRATRYDASAMSDTVRHINTVSGTDPRLRAVVFESQRLFARALADILIADASVEIVSDLDRIDADAVREHRPDLIVIDVDGARIDGAGMIRASRAAQPRARICALSMSRDGDDSQRCLDAGADAYIRKDLSAREFVRAVKSVAGGEAYVDPRVRRPMEQAT
jgi:two-component system response regulator DesR